MFNLKNKKKLKLEDTDPSNEIGEETENFKEELLTKEKFFKI